MDILIGIRTGGIMIKEPLDQWMDVFTTNDESEAAIIKGLFETEGVPCKVESLGVPQLPVSVGNLGRIKIMVRPRDFDKAGKILEAAGHEEEEEQ